MISKRIICHSRQGAEVALHTISQAQIAFRASMVVFLLLPGLCMAQAYSEEEFTTCTDLTGCGIGLCLSQDQELVAVAEAEIVSASAFSIRLYWSSGSPPSQAQEIGSLLLWNEYGEAIAWGRVAWDGGAILVDLVDF